MCGGKGIRRLEGNIGLEVELERKKVHFEFARTVLISRQLEL